MLRCCSVLSFDEAEVHRAQAQVERQTRTGVCRRAGGVCRRADVRAVQTLDVGTALMNWDSFGTALGVVVLVESL